MATNTTSIFIFEPVGRAANGSRRSCPALNRPSPSPSASATITHHRRRHWERRRRRRGGRRRRVGLRNRVVIDYVLRCLFAVLASHAYTHSTTIHASVAIPPTSPRSPSSAPIGPQTSYNPPAVPCSPPHRRSPTHTAPLPLPAPSVDTNPHLPPCALASPAHHPGERVGVPYAPAAKSRERVQMAK